MGTNYYHRTSICECCDRYDEQHIGKSHIMFEAPLYHDPANPYPPKPAVRSWSEWKERLLAGGEVWDEYGDQHKVEDFIAAVESSSPEARRRQYDHVKRVRPDMCDFEAFDCDWLDADGFSFHAGPFS